MSEPNQLFDDPQDRIARALMAQRTGLPEHPYRFDRSVDFNGSTKEHRPMKWSDVGMLAGTLGAFAPYKLTGRPLADIGGILTNGLKGIATGRAAGELHDLMGNAPFLNGTSNYREFSNPDGSEERIGRGLSGPQNPDGPQWSRLPRVYAP